MLLHENRELQDWVETHSNMLIRFYISNLTQLCTSTIHRKHQTLSA